MSNLTSPELEADAAPSGRLCPNPRCQQPMILYPHYLGLGPDITYDGRGWLCLNIAAHGGKPNTAAIWLDSELIEPMTEAEARALEVVVPWEVGS